MIGSISRHLVSDCRGNVLILFAISLVPMLLATGIAVDYARAAQLRTKLNAVADSAALSAVTQTTMDQSAVDAQTIAKGMFDQQALPLAGLFPARTQRTITVTDSSVSAGTSSTTRIAEVRYSAEVVNIFAGIIGLPIVTISGIAKATAAVASDTDFYMLLDSSPSMELPATTTGIAKMKSLTPTQGDARGCAFACHQSDRGDKHIAANPINSATGQRMDNYELARANNVILRTDLVNVAVSNLARTAKSAATTNRARYRMALATFNFDYRDIVAKPTDLDTVGARANEATVPIVCRSNQRVCGARDDSTSYFGTAFAGASANLPLQGGGGSGREGDTPEAILFIVTDGMRNDQSGRGPIDTSACDALKRRKIRIAILYTRYIPESIDDNWSIKNVQQPFLLPSDQIAPALATCASQGLYNMVKSDGDISLAMEQLFKRTISSAHLSK